MPTRMENKPSTFEEQSQMINHLQRRVRDNMKEKNSLIEMNSELETELTKKEKLIKDISEYHKKSRDEHKEALATNAKKMAISNHLIKSLQSENLILKRDLEKKNSEECGEIQKLFEEIEALKKTNKEKEANLENCEKEIVQTKSKYEELDKQNSDLYEKLRSVKHEKEDTKKLSDQLLEKTNLVQKLNEQQEDTLADLVKEKEHLEQQNEQLKEQIVKNITEIDQEQTLSDELGVFDPRAHNVSPAFQQTNLREHHTNDHENTLVKKIWRLKQVQLEKSIDSQKLKLTSDLLQLKEKELFGSVICACKTFCRITHQKHNWKKSTSQAIFLKFKTLDKAYCCNGCDKTFQNVDCLKLHMNTMHEGKMRK